MAVLNHPSVGPLELRFDLLSLMGTDGQVLIIYFPEPGAPSEDAVNELRTQLKAQPSLGDLPADERLFDAGTET
jgi:hypothetical protein